MKKRYFIFRHRQIGNVGAWELPKLKNQPEDGFFDEQSAINWLETKFANGKDYGFGQYDSAYWNQYIIMAVYSKLETKS